MTSIGALFFRSSRFPLSTGQACVGLCTLAFAGVIVYCTE
jgi:hypothetical protein